MQYTITRTTTEAFGVPEAENPKAALVIFNKGEANPISTNETVSVQPRPQPVPVSVTPIQTGVRITS